MAQLYLFDNLDLKTIYEDIYSVWQLKEAFRKVKAKKGGAGIDGQTIEEFEKNLDEEISKLSEELKGWTYEPSPVKRVNIPKPGGGERKIGIPTVRDRIVQYSIKMSIEWKYEQKFSESSFGFRPGRSQHQAIRKAQEYMKEGGLWIVDIDLEKFFDKINQDRLIWKLSETIEDKRVLRLIGMTLRSGIMEVNGIVSISEEGTTQGSPLSPLLSNIVLDELDKELEERELKFCRYADDAIIFCKSEKAAQRVMKTVRKYIEKQLKLKVNRKKSDIRTKEVTFLGITLIEGTTVISKKALKRANEKLRELIPRNNGKSIKQTIEEVNKWLRGWYGYFKVTEYPSQIKAIEAHIRRRLRAKIVRQYKRKRFLVRELIKRGVSEKTAYNGVYKRQGTWAISWSKAMHQGYINGWFKARGLLTPSENKIPHWKGLEKWIRLV